MNAGELDRRIDIQRGTATQSGSGAVSYEWSNVATAYPAKYRGAGRRNAERDREPQKQAGQEVEFTIRYRADLASLNPKDRIIYPALMAGLSPPDEITEDRVFDVLECYELGRRDWLVIRAARFSDGGALP